MKSKDSILNLVSSLADMHVAYSEEDTDDEYIKATSAYMARVRPSVDPPSGILNVRAHFEYRLYHTQQGKIYALADGGADSCILGKNAKVLSFTGRYANLVGYDAATSKMNNILIVTALNKVRSSSIGSLPVLLKIHEAPFNQQSPITLLSEYQIREYGLVIDSVAKKHCTLHGHHGTQRFHLSPWVHIHFEDRGGSYGI